MRHPHTPHAIVATAALLLTCIATSAMHATVLRVGAGRTLTLPSQAAAAAQDGDTIEIDAGAYVDCATWTRHNLLIRGVGGHAHVRDRACGGKAIWVVQGDNTTIEWIEFSGAAVPDDNGAGIRQEGAGLTVRHCFFHDNQNGILAGDRAGSVIIVEYSEFARNGAGDGYSHNMYINHVARFILRFCSVHNAMVGHNVKSRAWETLLLCNYIADEADGTSSRDIDIPNGGFAVIAGNAIQQGPLTENSNMCGYGLEGLSNPSRCLFVSCNTFVNDRGSGSFLSVPASGVDTLRIVNTIFAGGGTVLLGTAAVLDSAANFMTRDIARAGFTDAARYDYHLLPSSPAVDAGIDPGSAREFPLLPPDEYAHPAGSVPRTLSGRPDVGAFECAPSMGFATGNDGLPMRFTVEQIYPNPVSGTATLNFTLPRPAPVRVQIVALIGAVERETLVVCPAGQQRLTLMTEGLARGVHLCRVLSVAGTATRMMFVH
jgi:hypothetical protein